MRIKKLFWELLLEQQNDPDGEFEPDLPNQPVNVNEPPEDEPEQPEDDSDDRPDDIERQNQKARQKKVSPHAKIIAKWKEENPALDDGDADAAITFFNNRKNGLRVYKDPEKHPDYINLPEITSLVVRFPHLKPILMDISKIRDIQNYRWEEIEFFMDVTGTIQSTPFMDFRIEGDTPEIRKANALKKWESPHNRIINENGITVYRITGKDEAIALGRLQRILVAQYGGINWCIGNNDYPGSNEGRNLYATYRSYSVYYIVLNRNYQEDHRYYISTINVCDMNSSTGSNNGPYMITPRPNGTNTNQTWDDIVNIHPQLIGKKEFFTYYPLTPKEKASAKIDYINFNQYSDNFFGAQSFNIKKQYIESGRAINDKLSFRTLPYSKDNTKNLRKLYIDTVNLDNYKDKFKCSDINDPFGILNIIANETPQLYKYLDEYQLKQVLNIKRGVWAIKVSIIGSTYNPIGIDRKSNYVLYTDRSGVYYGIMNVDTIEWMEPMKFASTKTTPLRKGTDRFFLKRYSAMDGDYFYFLTNMKTYIDKNSPDYGVGQYLTAEEGNNLLESGEYRSFQKVIK